jgi:hypothetical protein
VIENNGRGGEDLNLRPSGAEPGFRAFFNSSVKERGGSFLFSKAYKSLYRRRFKEIEGAPLAAYCLARS